MDTGRGPLNLVGRAGVISVTMRIRSPAYEVKRPSSEPPCSREVEVGFQLDDRGVTSTGASAVMGPHYLLPAQRRPQRQRPRFVHFFHPRLIGLSILF